MVTKVVNIRRYLSYHLFSNAIGYYSSTGFAENIDGTIQCLPCPAGSFSTLGSLDCTVCSPGYYAPNENSSSCRACQAGKICEDQGCIECSSCPAGSFSIPGSSNCTLCSPGYYAPIEGSSSCYACQAGKVCENQGCTECHQCEKRYYISYATNICTRCPYPMVSIPGTTDKCNYLNLMVSSSAIIAIVVPIFVLYLFGLSYIIADKTKKVDSFKIYLGIFMLTFLPLVDIITDLLYILENDFYNPEIFAATLFFFFFPMTLFFKYLYDKNIRARFPLVQLPNNAFFDKYDSILKIFLTGVRLSPYVLINLPFFLPMMLSGIFLYATNLFSITRIKQFWVFLWTGIKQDEILEIADSYTLNTCLYTTILLESFPQMLIQTINNSKLNNWTSLAIISSVISGLSILDGIYRVVYYKLIMGINLVDVPVDISIVGIDLIKLDRSNTDDLELTVGNVMHAGEIVGNPNKDRGLFTEASEPLLKLQESVSEIKIENKDLQEEIRSIKQEIISLKHVFIFHRNTTNDIVKS